MENLLKLANTISNQSDLNLSSQTTSTINTTTPETLLPCVACGSPPRSDKRWQKQAYKVSNFYLLSPRIDPKSLPLTTRKCFNCSTTKTPMWRRDINNNPVCNSCGMYYRVNGINRPVNLRRGRSRRTFGPRLKLRNGNDSVIWRMVFTCDHEGRRDRLVLPRP